MTKTEQTQTQPRKPQARPQPQMTGPTGAPQAQQQGSASTQQSGTPTVQFTDWASI